jgi:hypothetical protein
MKPFIYSNINFEITSIEKSIKFGEKNAPENSAFLVLKVKLKNVSTKDYPVIIFPDEETKLIFEDKEILLENWKFNNNLNKGEETEGYLLFLIPDLPKKMVLQLGRKVGPKITVEIQV